jgi:hypothetical protein
MKLLIRKEDWLGPGSGRLGQNKAARENPRACRLVCRTERSHVSRETAGLSDWPSFEPYKAGADGQVLQFDPSVCGTCSEGEPLFRYYPKRYRQRSCASVGWGVREVPLRHRRVGRVGLRERGPSFPVFQWLEQYVRFPREKYNSAEVRCVSQYPLGKTSFLRARHEDGRR